MESSFTKKAILTSIIATILFVYLLDPLLKIIGTLLFKFGSNIFRSYIDSLYQNAALLLIPDPSSSFVNFAVGGIVGTMISITIFLFLRRKKGLRPHGSILSLFVEKYLRWFFLLISLLYIPMSFSTIFSNNFQSKLVSSFNQHLIAVAPYVNDNEIKILKSKWTQMNNQKDYKAIYKQLNQIAQNNNIVLPVNRLY